MRPINVLDITIAAYEINRALAQSQGDDSQTTWHEAPDWHKAIVENGVRFHLDHPHATPEEAHENWKAQREAAGWKYGPVKDEAKKEHPKILPYAEVPAVEKTKDFLFKQIVNSLERFFPN